MYNTELEKIDAVLTIQSLIKIEVHFISKVSFQGEYNYTAYKADIDNNVLKNDIFPLTTSFVKSYIQDKNLYDFSAEANSPDEIYKIKSDESQEYNKIIESINSSNEYLIEGENDLTNAHAYVISITYNDQSDEQVLYLFKKYSNPKIIKRKSVILLGYIHDKFEKIETKMISIDEKIDAVSCDENLYILHQFNFENIFNFKSEYIKLRDQVISNLEDQQSDIFYDIDSFELFSNHCNDGRYIRQFGKVNEFDGIRVLKDNIDQIEKIKEDFILEISIKDGKIKYEDKHAFADVLKLLTGKFVYNALDLDPVEAIATRRRNR